MQPTSLTSMNWVVSLASERKKAPECWPSLPSQALDRLCGVIVSQLYLDFFGHFVLVIAAENVFTDLLMKSDQIVPAFERRTTRIIVITNLTLTQQIGSDEDFKPFALPTSTSFHTDNDNTLKALLDAAAGKKSLWLVMRNLMLLGGEILGWAITGGAARSPRSANFRRG